MPLAPFCFSSKRAFSFVAFVFPLQQALPGAVLAVMLTALCGSL